MTDNKEKHNCKTCRYFSHDEDMLDGDFICINDQSENLADYVSYKDSCSKWESGCLDV